MNVEHIEPCSWPWPACCSGLLNFRVYLFRDEDLAITVVRSAVDEQAKTNTSCALCLAPGVGLRIVLGRRRMRDSLSLCITADHRVCIAAAQRRFEAIETHVQPRQRHPRRVQVKASGYLVTQLTSYDMGVVFSRQNFVNLS